MYQVKQYLKTLSHMHIEKSQTSLRINTVCSVFPFYLNGSFDPESQYLPTCNVHCADFLVSSSPFRLFYQNWDDQSW